MKAHVSDLEIDSDDVSIYIAQYPDMFLEMHLDYVGHKTERMMQIFTNKNRMVVDLLSVTIFIYKKEMEYFIDCVEIKRTNIHTIQNAYNTLKIALAEE